MDERSGSKEEKRYSCHDNVAMNLVRSYGAKVPRLVFVFVILFSCSVKIHQHDLLAAFHRYNIVLITMNADSIAALFTPDGKLGSMAKGRDAIAHELKKYDFVRILSEETSADSTWLMGHDKGMIKGRYWQKDILLRSGDTVLLSGTLYETWMRINGKWLLDSIDTKPLKHQ